MTTPLAAAPLPGDVSSEALLRTLLAISPLGILLMRPLYAAPDAATPVDFAWVQLNPAAQQMLGLAECPAESFLTVYPTAPAAGVFGFYRDAFVSGQVARRQNLYQHDGLDGYYRLVAQRQGPLLLVTFTDANDEPRSVIEEALRASQAREQAARAEAEAERRQLYQVLRQLPAQVATYAGPDHVFAFLNARFEAYVPGADLLGRPVREASAGVVGEEVFAMLDQVYTTGDLVQAREVEVQLPGVPSVFLNTSYQPLRDGQGRIYGVLDFSYDVTEQVLARRQVEQLNQELEVRVQARTQQALALQAKVLAVAQAQVQVRETFYQVFEQTPALIALLRGPGHRFEYVNPSFPALFAGRPLVGLTVAQAIPELFEQGFGLLLDRVYQTGETHFGLEVPFAPAAAAGQPAQTSYFTFTYQVLREAGAVTGISIFAYDVTVQLREREASAQQLRLITDALPVLISYLDGEEIYRFVNRAYEPWFNQRAADLVGQSVRAVVGEPAYRAAKPYIDRALAGERVEFEGRMPYREGFTKYIHSTFVPAQRAGVPAGFYTLTVDITEQVLARQQVQALNEELMATNQELHTTNQQLTRTNVDLDTFVYTASHDLKAPITNIESILLALRDTLPAEVQQDELVAHLLDLLAHTTARFQLTIGQLTDLSKLQLAHAGPAEPVNLAAAVEAVRLDLTPLITAAEVQLTVEVAPDLVVSFSPANLRSTLYNLLSNAVKYRAPDRPAQVHLRAFSAGAGSQVVVAVQDNGLGLSAHQQQRVFGLFQRLHTHVEGTGVGLYITKRLVENGGGTIAVESELGVGTTFRVTFPTLA